MYNYSFDIITIFLLLFCLFGAIWKKDSLKEEHTRLYFFLVINVLLSDLFQILFAVYMNKGDSSSLIAAVCFYYIYTLFHVCLTSLVIMYTYLITSGNNTAKKRRFQIIASIPVILNIIVLIISLSVNLTIGSDTMFNLFDIETIDGKNVFVSGAMQLIILGVSSGFGLIAIYLIIRYHSHISGRFSPFFFIFFLLALSASSLTQYFNPTLLIEQFINAIGIVYFLIIIENQDDRYDIVSGLLNYPAFNADLEDSYSKLEKSSVLFIRLENYSYYASSISVSSLHQVRRDIAAFLLEKKIKGLSFYDFANGKFAVIASEASMPDLEDFAKTLSDRFIEPWIISNNEIYFTTSLVLFSVPKDIASPEDMSLLLNTNLITDTSYRVQLFHGDSIAFIHRQTLIKKAIQETLDKDSISINIQALYNVKTHKIASCEILARINNDELGYIGPKDFIPIAEKTGMINRLSERIFEKTCQFLNSISKLDLIKAVSIFVSPIQLLQPGFIEKIKKIAEEYFIPMDTFVFAIKQNTAIEDKRTYDAALEELFRNDLRYSFYDFGVGYYNEEDIYKYKFFGVKLDRSLLRDSFLSDKADIILKYTIQNLQDCGFKVCGQGAENQADADKLIAYGADFIQGYYYGRPMPCEEFVKFAKDFNARSK